MPVKWWKAVESLSLLGSTARVGDAGMTLRGGSAEVKFGSDWSGTGAKHFVYEFSGVFDVVSSEEAGLGADLLSYSSSNTSYYALLRNSLTPAQVLRSFTGLFETVGISKGFFILGGAVGYTYGFDVENKTRVVAWQGQTTGWSIGFGVGMIFGSRANYYNERFK